MRGRLRLLVMGLVASCALATASTSPAPASERTGPVELGSAINDGAFNGAEPNAYRDTFLRHHDAATHEHSMKMIAVQPERGRWEFGQADAIADWTIRNGKRLHGHTLLWCRDEWTPGWVTSRAWTREELLDVMTEHIRTVVGRYRGRAASWDVVNEALTKTGTREPCVWERYIGPDWIELAYRAAAAADPDARLFYNEYAAETPNTKFVAMEALAKDLLAKDVPLHGIGFQHHTYGFQPVQDRIEEAMARVGALGLAVHVSEMDVPTYLIPGTTDEKLAQQAQAYETVAAACQAQPACFRFTTWGFVDGIGWRPAWEMSAPFDTSLRPKAAWQAMQRVLRPTAAPKWNRPPSAPGTPVRSTAIATKDLTVTWSPASDADRQPLTYTLQHRDADDTAWTTVATGIRGTTFRFDGGRLEKQGTLTYRALADDGYVAGGASVASEPVTVDRSAPFAPTPTATRPAEWTAGDMPWFRDTVTIGFADGGDQALPDGSAGTGVDPASVPADVTVAAAGAHSASGQVRDRAGNVSAVRTRSFSVDAAPPVVSVGTRAGDADYRGGWTRSAVTVTWTCADEGTGVAELSPAETVDTEGANQRLTGVCKDRVGHVARLASDPIDIDRTPPAAPRITTDRPEDAAGGWFADHVTVGFEGAGDPLADGTSGSGVDPASLPAARVLTAAETVRADVSDRAGNVSVVAEREVRIDATPPVVALTCPSTVEQGADAVATWSASDAGAGLSTPDTGTVPLDTGTAGTQHAGVTARDRVGHARDAGCEYTVTARSSDPPPADPPPADPPPSDPPVDDPPPAEMPIDDTTGDTPAPESEAMSAATSEEPAASAGATDSGSTATAMPAAIASTGAPVVALPPPPPSALAPTPSWDLRTTAVRAGRAGVLRLVLACRASAATTCRPALVLKDGRATAARTRRLSIAPGRRTTTSVRLSRSARSRLRRRGRLVLAVAADGRRVATLRVRAR